MSIFDGHEGRPGFDYMVGDCATLKKNRKSYQTRLGRGVIHSGKRFCKQA